MGKNKHYKVVQNFPYRPANKSFWKKLKMWTRPKIKIS